jgi:hypothetical protein
MSVYSGFSTRVLETKYGKLCEMLIGLLSNKVLRTLKGEKSDDNQFSKQLTSLYLKLTKLESIKYLPPKLSVGCNELADYCNSNYDFSPSSSSSILEIEVSPSPRILKTLSPISSYPLEQINEENIKDKKKILFGQEKFPRPIQTTIEDNDFNANSYYEKVMEKYIKLSNRYAPKHERSFSVGNKDHNPFYKDGILFKS